MGIFHSENKPVPEYRAAQPGDRPTEKKLLAQIVRENAWDMILFNVLYTLLCLPMLISLWSFLFVDFPLLFSAGGLLLSALLAGPASVAMAKLICGWLRGKAYEPFRLFFSAFRANFMQGMGLGLLLHGTAALLLIALTVYLYNAATPLVVVLLVLTVFLLALLLPTIFYSYMMLANIDLPLFQILRNTVLLLFISAKSTLLILFIVLTASLICFAFQPITLFLIPLVYFIAIWLLCGSLCWQTILRHVAREQPTPEEE